MTMEEDKVIWYRERGTGRIYKITQVKRYVTISSRKVFEV